MSEHEKNISLKLTKFEELTRVIDGFTYLSDAIGVYKDIGKIGTFINLNDLIYTSRGIYNVFPDNSIKKIILYQGERHFRMTEKLESNIDPSFHLYKCDIIKKQIEQRSKLFKITTRKDGNFMVTDHRFDEHMKRVEEKSYKKLLVCNLCFIMYNRIKRGDFPKEDFKIKDYFDSGHSNLTFTYNFDEIPIGYKNNWQEIASALKEKRNYTCEKCKITIEKLYSEKFLNIHFSTEQIYTKSVDKLKVLCLRCHADEPNHEHLIEKTEYKHFKDYLDARKI